MTPMAYIHIKINNIFIDPKGEKMPKKLVADVEVKQERIAMPDEDEILDLADFFKIFSDSTRMKILLAIDESALCVSEISEVLGISVSCVSHQLKVLKTSNLIKSERRGKNIYYTLADCHVRDIIRMALEHIEE